MSEPNILLEVLIEDAGLSHAGLASRLNKVGERSGLMLRYDHASVARWIRDHAVPRDPVPDLICGLLGSRLGRVLTLADVGLDRSREAQEGDIPLQRVVDRAVAVWRSDLKRGACRPDTPLMTGAAAVAPVFEWENPPYDVDVSREGCGVVDLADVRRLQDARVRYEQMYRRVGGLPVRPRVLGFLNDHVTPLLKSTYDNARGKQVFRAAGSLVALAGISTYDADLQASAQRYFFHALRMAKACGDRGFGGYVVALLANQAMHRGNHRQVLQYAETALRAARSHMTPALITDLHGLQAKAHARMGDPGACHQHLHRSESMAARIRPGEEPPETGYVQPGLVEVQHAEALRQLGELPAAQRYAEGAVDTAGVTHLRGQVHRLAALALVLIARGEIDYGANVATQMLERAEGMESWRIRDRVLAVADMLRPHRSVPGADEFLDRIAGQLDVPM